MRANNEHAKSLVNKFRLRVTRLVDNNKFILSPAINRQRALNPAFLGGEESRGTLWLPFLIEADVAVPFDILFRYEPASSELPKLATVLERAWIAYLREEELKNPAALADLDPAAAQAKLRTFAKACFDASQNEPFLIDARAKLTECLIWRASDYACNLEIEAVGSKKIFSRKLEFALTEDDSHRLLANVDLMLGIVCKQIDANTPYNSAYADLRTA